MSGLKVLEHLYMACQLYLWGFPAAREASELQTCAQISCVSCNLPVELGLNSDLWKPEPGAIIWVFAGWPVALTGQTGVKCSFAETCDGLYLKEYLTLAPGKALTRWASC